MVRQGGSPARCLRPIALPSRRFVTHCARRMPHHLLSASCRTGFVKSFRPTKLDHRPAGVNVRCRQGRPAPSLSPEDACRAPSTGCFRDKTSIVIRSALHDIEALARRRFARHSPRNSCTRFSSPVICPSCDGPRVKQSVAHLRTVGHLDGLIQRSAGIIGYERPSSPRCEVRRDAPSPGSVVWRSRVNDVAVVGLSHERGWHVGLISSRITSISISF